MRDRPIQVGDLVQVVHSCCETKIKRLIFEVLEMSSTASMQWRCSYCGAYYPAGPLAENTESIYPVSWLKRIPPLSDDEQREELADLGALDAASRALRKTEKA